MSQHYIFGQEDTTLPNMLQIQIQKTRKQRVTAAQYMLIYKGLQLLSQNGNLPMSKYRITNQRTVQDLMIDNKFITVCENEKMVSEYYLHKDTKYYCIAPKGFEYMRTFEKLEGLFD